MFAVSCHLTPGFFFFFSFFFLLNRLLANSRIEHFLHMDMVSFINPYNRKCWKSMAMAPAEQIFKCIPTAWKLMLISETHDRILILASNLGFKKFLHSNLEFRISN